jgi:hypothetical protein
MIVASMIDAVIMPRFATGARASLLTRHCPFAKELPFADHKHGRSLRQTSIERA